MKKNIEIWKDIPDYEGLYEASSFGRIRTHKNKTTYTQKHGIRHWKSRIMKGRGDFYTTGRRVGLWKNGKVKDWLVARLIAITFLGKPTKEANTVNHINGNRLDNRIENLEWLSRANNIRHAFNNNLMSSCKKVRLYNDKENKSFYSMRNASDYIGRSKSYIRWCVQKERNAKAINGEIYKIEIMN